MEYLSQEAFVQSVDHLLHMAGDHFTEIDREPEKIGHLLVGAVIDVDKLGDPGEGMHPKTVITHESIDIEAIGGEHLDEPFLIDIHEPAIPQDGGHNLPHIGLQVELDSEQVVVVDIPGLVQDAEGDHRAGLRHFAPGAQGRG